MRRPGLSGIDSLGLPVIKSVKVLEKLDPTHMVALQLREHKLETGTPYFVFRGPDFTIAILAWKEPLKAMAIRRHQRGLFVVVMVGVGVCACLSAGRVHAQSDDKHPVVVLDTSFGPITIELDQEKAPITAENFLKYVDDGFYDNLIFHRVIPRFMIQGGGFDAQMQEKIGRAEREDQERVEQRFEQRPRHDRDGADRRSQLGPESVFHQSRGQPRARLPAARRATPSLAR